MQCPSCSTFVSAGINQCPVCGTPLGLQVLGAGAVLQGKYRINSELGRGGFGVTYAATQLMLGSLVAIKEMFPSGCIRQGMTITPPTTLDSTGWQQAKNDFIAEARALARFNHPDIVRVLDLFEANGTAYMVMEHLEGETLQAKIDRQGRLSPLVVSSLAQRVAQGLDLVHSAGLLHRDLKPDNIFIERSGRVVLIDFGSARGFVTGKTVRHTQLVTPGYAPMEQYGNAAKFGPYTDFYALGATLYHALTGEMPPSAPDRLVGEPLKALPFSVPVELRRVIEQSMQIKVADRPQHAKDILALLDINTAQPSNPPSSNLPPSPQPKSPIPQPPLPPVPAPIPTMPKPVVTRRARSSSGKWWWLALGLGGVWAYQQLKPASIAFAPPAQSAPEQATTDQPSTDQPSTDQPSTDQPSTDQPNTDQSTEEANIPPAPAPVETTPTTELEPITPVEPEAVVLPPNPSSEAAPVVQEDMTEAELEGFVDQYFALGQGDDFNSIMALYAPEVDYFDQGFKDKSFLYQDKQGYFKRWPLREYRRTSGITTLSQQGNSREIRFDYHYLVFRKGNKLEGDAYAILGLTKESGMVLINREQGAIYPKTQAKTITSAPKLLGWHFDGCQDPETGETFGTLQAGKLQYCQLVIDFEPNGSLLTSADFNYELEFEENGAPLKLIIDTPDHWPSASQPETKFSQTENTFIFDLPLTVKDRLDRQYNKINVTGKIFFDNGSSKQIYEQLDISSTQSGDY